jgi:hypothetical protein
MRSFLSLIGHVALNTACCLVQLSSIAYAIIPSSIAFKDVEDLNNVFKGSMLGPPFMQYCELRL